MFLACLFVLILMRVRGVSLRTNLKELRWFAFLGFFYYGSAALLFQGYHTMSSGMATTLHFLYPIGTTLIMAIVFRQRTSIYTVIAIALGLSGVSLLSLRGGVGQTTSIIGILLVLLSGLSYAIYLVTVNNVRRLREMDNLKLTFYAIFFSGIFFLTDTLLSGGIQPIPSRGAIVNLLLLALLPTLISNLALVRAIKSIGSTLTSVLGAMEPLTAIVMGVLFLGEQVSSVMLLGVILILSAVTIIVLSPLLDKNIADRLKRFAKK
jgi:membrane protein